MAGRVVVVSAETFDRLLTMWEAAQVVVDEWKDNPFSGYAVEVLRDALAALDDQPQSIRELVDRGKP